MRFFHLFLIGCTAALLTGCQSSRPIQWQTEGVDLVWPPAPETSRIRFLRTVPSLEGAAEPDRSRGLLQWVTGETGDDVPLLSPYGVTADGEGRVWVADSGGGAVQVFDLNRDRVDLLTSFGTSPLQSPLGIVFDPARKRLYVSDPGAGTVLVGDGKGKYLGECRPPEGFGRPGGVAIDSAGNLYVVDVLRGVIEVFSPEQKHLRTVGSGIAADRRFNRPSNLWVDAEGRIFVSDSMNFRIEIIAPDGTTLGTIGGLGDVPGTFSRPRGVAVDSAGHVYVADAAFDNIQIFDLTGRLLLYFGGTGRDPGKFNLPAGLFFDAKDRLYAVDAYNRRVQIFQYLPFGEK